LGQQCDYSVRYNFKDVNKNCVIEKVDLEGNPAWDRKYILSILFGDEVGFVVDADLQRDDNHWSFEQYRLLANFMSTLLVSVKEAQTPHPAASPMVYAVRLTRTIYSSNTKAAPFTFK